MALTAPNRFYCDVCGEIIESVDDGWLEWIDDGVHPIHGFRIVHCAGKSPRSIRHGSCYYPEHTKVSDSHLKFYTGDDGLAYLLSFFDRNLLDPKELAEIIRRLHIPHYEEARRFLNKACMEGFIENRDCSQDDLKAVIAEYS